MAQQRRRARRNALAFAVSLGAHVVAFFIAISQFHFYPQPRLPEEAVQVQIVPPPVEIPPPPPPVEKPKIVNTPQPQPPAPQPQPQPQPNPPQPQPTKAPPKPAATPAAQESGLVRQTPTPSPTPSPKPAPSPTPLPSPSPAPQPGPPKAVPASSLVSTQTHTVATPETVKLRKKEAEEASRLAPGNLPTGFPAPTPPGGAPAAGAPGGGAPGGAPGGGAAVAGFPRGGMPKGFGGDWGIVGCVNQAVMKLTTAQKAKCQERWGSGALIAPKMDPIGSTRRTSLDEDSAKEQAAEKYKDEMPDHRGGVIPGQPRVGHTPTNP